MALPEQFDAAPIADMVVTPQGEALLNDSPVLQAAILGYASRTTGPAQDALRGMDGLTFVGEGDNSQVWRAGDTAIKVNTPTTGREYYRYVTPVKPEDLIGQTTFMHALAVDLAARSVDDISVPQQHLALRTTTGDQLSVQEYVDGWTSWFDWTSRRKMDAVSTIDLREHLKLRIIGAMGGSALAVGVSDLGLRRNAKLHGGNVLVPSDCESAADAPLCIIDQPSKGIRGKLGLVMARHVLRASDAAELASPKLAGAYN